MSFEGYDDVICSKGHLTSQNSLCESDICNHMVSASSETGIVYCNADIVWRNTVDQTNGEDVGLIKRSDMDKFIITPEVMETCSHCGHTKRISPALYRPPTKEETKAIQTITTSDGIEYLAQ
jgi:hypothetical protein